MKLSRKLHLVGQTALKNKSYLHKKLNDALLEEILQMKAGQKIPSERQLCEIYGVSRTTVRNAILDLEYQGKLRRIQGKGTFVTAPKDSRENLSHYYSFTEETKKRGKIPRSAILEYHIVKASIQVKEALGLFMGEDVIEFLRLRLANEEPMMLERTFIPYNQFPEVTRKMLETVPLYDIFEKQYNRKIYTVNESFSVALLDTKQADLLGEKAHHPCLKIERKSYDIDDRAIEFTTSVAAGNKFNYETTYNPQ